jgi:hypothetical protein
MDLKEIPMSWNNENDALILLTCSGVVTGRV